MKKICIVNAHWSNRGDEAALRAIINKLQELYEDSEIRVIFKDDKSVEQFPYQGNITCFSAKFLPRNLMEMLVAVISRGKWCINPSMKKEIQEMRNQDIIIYSPGGAVISDQFWWRKQLEYLLPFLCSRCYKIPMAVAAPSIGFFGDYPWRNFVRRKMLHIPAFLCVREEISQDYLKEIGVTKNVLVTIDTAFFDMPDMKEQEKLLVRYTELSDFLKSYPKIIGMTVSDFKWHVTYSGQPELRNKIMDSIQQFILERNKEGIGIILIPQLFGNQNDTELLKAFQAENTFLLSDKMDAYFQQFLTSRLYAVVGMRYHSNIFAAKMGVPFLAIAYEDKMRGFMKTWGLNDYTIDLNKLSFEELENRWGILKMHYEDYKKYLRNHHDIWKGKAEKTVHEVCRLIDIC